MSTVGAELDQPAGDAGMLRLKRQDQIILRDIELDPALLTGVPSSLGPAAFALCCTTLRPPPRRPAPRHQARIAFCAWSRFSASSQTTDCGPSITSSVTSSPRWAGRQCMKIASFAAAAITFSSTWNGEAPLRACSRLVAHRHPDVGHDAIGAPRRLERIVGHIDRRAFRLAQSSRPAPAKRRRRGDPQREAEARRGMHPGGRDIVAVADPGDRAAFDRPFFSSKVITSAMTWQGCDRSVRPLITGTVACAASSVSVSCGRCGS